MLFVARGLIFNLLLAVATMALTATAVDSQADYDPQPIPGRYICELSGPDVGTDGKRLLDTLKSQFSGYEVTMPRTFDYSIFKAVTIQISRTARDGGNNLLASISTDQENLIVDALKIIADTGLIAKVYPVYTLHAPTVMASAPADENADYSMMMPHHETQVDRVHNELGNTGAGIKVAVIDGDFDYMHPALGGGFGPGYKVQYGRDLIGDNYDPDKKIPPQPDNDPAGNCDPKGRGYGHGTHVSGIIAGKSEHFVGVAPDAILGMWRVSSCSGRTDTELLTEAMCDAYDTGVDLINLSIGGGFEGWPESSDAVVAERISANGVPIIASAGNDGNYGAFSSSSPSVGKGVFSVASVDNGYELNDQSQIIPVPTKNLVSYFSSIGASSELDMKPNIAGVGGFVYSTLPRNAGSWGMMSGTSMAAPYVAGSVALYLKSREGSPRPSTAEILQQFQNYAAQTSDASRQNIDTPYRQSAGLVQVYDTIQQQVHIAPGDISFNDTANMQRTHTLTITNNGNSVVQYQLINQVSVSVIPYGQFRPFFAEPAAYGQDFASLTFSQDTFQIPPSGQVKITVTVTPPDTDPKEHIMYGGFIQFKDLRNQRNLSVPYIGIVGNQRDLPIYYPGTPFTTTNTATVQKGDMFPSPLYGPNDTFVFDRSNPQPTRPVFGLVLPSPVRDIRAPLYNANGVQIGLAFTKTNNLRRASTKGPFKKFEWEGTFTPDILGANIPVPLSVPPGVYRIGFEALKWLGDPNNKNDREVWMSCAIQVT